MEEFGKYWIKHSWTIRNAKLCCFCAFLPTISLLPFNPSSTWSMVKGDGERIHIFRLFFRGARTRKKSSWGDIRKGTAKHTCCVFFFLFSCFAPSVLSLFLFVGRGEKQEVKWLSSCEKHIQLNLYSYPQKARVSRKSELIFLLID